MKQTLLPALAASVVLLSPSAQAVVLFADTFDRSDSTDLNASTSGKSGTLGALNWSENSSPGGTPVLNEGGDSFIASNQLRIGENGPGGAGWAISYLNHNFTDAAILSNKEFTVSVDLVGTLNSVGGTRFLGFMVGNSLTEMSGWNSNNPTATSWTPDFFFGYDTTGTNEVKVFTNGNNEAYQQTIDLDSGATLMATFSNISNFNAGSSVDYEVFINGTSVNTGSFTWSETNENYIGLYSNYTENQGTLDNFTITSIPEPSAALLSGVCLLTALARRRRTA